MCAPCQAAAAAQSQNRNQRSQEVIVTDCNVTKSLLQAWQTALKCVKAHNQQALIGMAMVQVNQMLGILQSALNYPDNYCYYYPQLEYFQSAILPQIISNVPQCLG